jgi:hypothetical protein
MQHTSSTEYLLNQTNQTPAEIGGYFSLEVPLRSSSLSNLRTNAYYFQSARAALAALLIEVKPKRIFLPFFICDAVLSSVQCAGVEFEFYALSQSLNVLEEVHLNDTDVLLYVDYFGVSSANVKQVLRRFNPRQVIIDCSQSYFAHYPAALACIYSPRKFFGVPDGGILQTDFPLHNSYEQDQDSLARSAHLLTRLAQGAQAGYAAFQWAEQSLNDPYPRTMSQLTQHLLAACDEEQGKQIRLRNFAYLHQALSEINQLNLQPEGSTVPLCYPLLIQNSELRPRLLQHGVFVATYWKDVLTRVDANSCEALMTHYCLALPIDQRYSETHMQVIVDIVKSVGIAAVGMDTVETK